MQPYLGCVPSYTEPFPQMGRTDEHNHYIAKVGELIHDRYRVNGRLGNGTFGYVYQAVDRVTNLQVAVKIVRRIARYEMAAIQERSVLIDTLHHHEAACHRPISEYTYSPMPPGVHTVMASSAEPARLVVTLRAYGETMHGTPLPTTVTDGHVVRLLHGFPYRGHMCLVMPLLSSSLTSLIRSNEHGLPPNWLRAFTTSLCRGVAEIHGAGFVHTDIKPDNVLLRAGQLQEFQCNDQAGPSVYRLPASTSLCVIDLGSAVADAENHTYLICTRQYRPPEAVLGLPWGRPADVWAVACVVFEILTGNLLFRTHDTWEHLYLMQRLIGPPSRDLVRCAMATTKSGKYFTADDTSPTGYSVVWPPTEPSEDSEQRQMREVVEAVGSLRSLLHDAPDYARAFIEECLTWDQHARPSIDILLQHPFLTYRAASTQTDDVVDADAAAGAGAVALPARPSRIPPLGTRGTPFGREVTAREEQFHMECLYFTMVGYCRSVARALNERVIESMIISALEAPAEERYLRLVGVCGYVRSFQFDPYYADKIRNTNYVYDGPPDQQTLCDHV